MAEMIPSALGVDASRIVAQEPRNHAVACVIPFYNGSRFIERAIKSVITQTVPVKELIIVNDGSGPDEVKALELIAGQYPAIIVLHKENGGQGSARNYGVAHAQSPFVCFLDQDDFFLPRHVEILAESVDDDDPLYAYSYGDLYVADVDGKIHSHSIAVKRAIHPKHDISDYLSEDMFILPSAAIIKKDAFLSVGGFDDRMAGYEDDDLFLRFFSTGYSSKFLPVSVTVWCINSESTSFGIRMSRSRMIYFEKLCKEYRDDPSLAKYYVRDYLAKRFLPCFVSDLMRGAMMNSPYKGEFIERLQHALLLVGKRVSGFYRMKCRALIWVSESNSRFAYAIFSRIYLLKKSRTIRKLIGVLF